MLPQYQCRGYGTAILHHSMTIASAIGVERILITCDDTNTGSRRIIESCGGVLESSVIGHSVLERKGRALNTFAVFNRRVEDCPSVRPEYRLLEYRSLPVRNPLLAVPALG